MRCSVYAACLYIDYHDLFRLQYKPSVAITHVIETQCTVYHLDLLVTCSKKYSLEAFVVTN